MPNDQGDVPSSVVVVVPARNEERRLDACLRGLRVAIRRLRSSDEVLPVRVVLVLDRCTDRTAAVAAGWPPVEVVVTEHGRVGAARAAGVWYAIAAADRDVDAMWIANTDADSVVPPDWLRTQLRHARGGADLVLGMVCPDPAEVPDQLRLAWHDRHVFVDGHRHVHGANMGVRGGMYVAAGGFPDVAVDEDVALADSIRRMGGRVVSTRASPVTTSARLSGRTPGGMAAYLRDLVRPVHPGPAVQAQERAVVK
jgi:glycosyltransferase involved in cell wall biosynthesis